MPPDAVGSLQAACRGASACVRRPSAARAARSAGCTIVVQCRVRGKFLARTCKICWVVQAAARGRRV